MRLRSVSKRRTRAVLASAAAGCVAFAWWRIVSVLADIAWSGLIVEVLIVHGFVLLVVGPLVAVVAFGLGVRGTGVLAVTALIAGSIAALPVEVGWDDGCNGHVGQIPLVAAPYVDQAKPESFHLTYGTTSTLSYCPDARRSVHVSPADRSAET